MCPAFSGAVFIVSVPRDQANWNSGSVSISEEYEVFAKASISRNQIVETFPISQLRVDPSKLSRDQLRILDAVFDYVVPPPPSHAQNEIAQPEILFTGLNLENVVVVTPDDVPVWSMPMDHPELRATNR
jgi:hypothetical protein